jgi:antitoxin component of RelBE/YafQ-DinJ toxin-antitoxin module
MNQKKIVKSFRIDPWLDKEVKQFCEKTGITLTDLLNNVLTNMVVEMNEGFLTETFTEGD